MDTLEKIDQLLELVGEIASTAYAITEGPKWDKFSQLDAEIAGECGYLGVTMPSYALYMQQGASRVPYGFVKVPRGMTNFGWRLYATEEWQQAMQGLRGAVRVAFERQIDPNDIALAKTQGAIADFAAATFGERPSDRSIQNWIDNKSLRTRKRGILWEFSKSDLRALVLGRSE